MSDRQRRGGRARGRKAGPRGGQRRILLTARFFDIMQPQKRLLNFLYSPPYSVVSCAGAVVGVVGQVAVGVVKRLAGHRWRMAGAAQAGRGWAFVGLFVSWWRGKRPGAFSGRFGWVGVA